MKPPASVVGEIATLEAAVAAHVPAKGVGNLLIGTWNLRAFGGLTNKWSAGAGDSPKRDWRAVALIATLLSHFDVVAVQEVKRNLAALRFLIERLGPRWQFITSDVTEGSTGNEERLTFLYDSDRVQPSGLVGEIVLPPAAGAPVQQFARSPYAASFRRGTVDFILTTLHVLWGDSPAARLPEITNLAQWMRAWAERPREWNENLLVLGDFNIDRIDNPLYEAFVSTGLWAPTELSTVPRTIFDNDGDNHFYDQIAWFSNDEDPTPRSLLQSLKYSQRAGTFDFLPYTFAGLTRSEVSWRMSDHYPLWVEFDIGAP